MFSWNNVPAPDNGAPSNENAEIRNVLIGPATAPGSTFPDTFQFPLVNPAFTTGGSWNVTIRSSKMKSPWNPINCVLGSITVVVTAAETSLCPALTVTFGKATVVP